MDKGKFSLPKTHILVIKFLLNILPLFNHFVKEIKITFLGNSLQFFI